MSNNYTIREMFFKSKGKPVEYKGKMIQMADDFIIPSDVCKLRFEIISTNSEWKQGFELLLTGSFNATDKAAKRGVVIWEDTAPKSDIIEVYTKERVVIVSNIWDHGDGVKQKWFNNGALYFEEIENGKRYYCNDGNWDDDFDDIIFELVIVE